ncbi:MAG: ribosomal L7Ae/L30e/S12e/Gadd45 family protein [Lachnospiraceae bacterium]|nr:ribosomal L7Ae/L30e/S12e/Gadd45 family protein [Lachnospiraceae bacterium]
MKSNDRAMSMMSMAAKAGKIVSGEFMVEKTVKEGKVYLVIVSEEASANTVKKFSNMCFFYKVPMYIYGTKDSLGHNIGREARASVAVTDEGFANSIVKNLPDTVTQVK